MYNRKYIFEGEEMDMAVTIPNAPTPPSPPSVPQVTLEGGGSVRESTVPQSGQQTDAERQETQARQAVARGDGALSKTTQEQPQTKTQNTQGAQNGQQNPNASANTVVKTDPQAIAAMQDSGQQSEQGQEQTTQTSTVAQIPSSLGEHGIGYWAFTFFAVFVLAFVVFRVVLKKRSGIKGELSAEDIRQAITPEAEEYPVNLRGLTPDEALRRLEEQEAMDAATEIRKARAEAKERLSKARAQGNLYPEVSAAAVPKTAAKEYREQVTAMLPDKRVQPKKIVRKQAQASDDKEHFEVSV